MTKKQRVFPDQFEGQFDRADEEAFELTLDIALRIGNGKGIEVQVVIPHDYPYDALEVEFGDSYGISTSLLSTLEREVPP